MSLAIVIHITHFIAFNVLGPLCNGDKHLCCKKEKNNAERKMEMHCSINIAVVVFRITTHTKNLPGTLEAILISKSNFLQDPYKLKMGVHCRV